MADLRGFNAHSVEPNEAFDPIPAGEYLCVLVNSEDKATKSGNGSYLELEFEVIEGPCQGRKVWDRLNLNNPNELAVKIAQATLSALCRAIGVMEPKDSCELHDYPLLVKVRQEKRSDTDELPNVIKGYRSRQAGQAVASPAPLAKSRDGGTPTQAPVGGPPWRRK